LPVADRGGVVVGHFSHMTYQDEGREKAVITLNNNKSIAVTGDHLRLDPDRDTVLADLTYDELNSMPARSKTPAADEEVKRNLLPGRKEVSCRIIPTS
jgi:hypothetical protein